MGFCCRGLICRRRSFAMNGEKSLRAATENTEVLEPVEDRPPFARRGMQLAHDPIGCPSLLVQNPASEQIRISEERRRRDFARIFVKVPIEKPAPVVEDVLCRN